MFTPNSTFEASQACNCAGLRHISEALDTVLPDLSRQMIRYWIACANDLSGEERDAALDLADQVAATGIRRHGERSKERRRAVLAMATAPKPRPIGERAAKIVAGMKFRRRAERLYQLGPRAVAEALAEIEARSERPETVEGVIGRFASIDPKALRQAGGYGLSQAPMRAVN